MPHEFPSADTQATDQQQSQQLGFESRTMSVGSHERVVRTDEFPPWLHCHRCGAKRSTRVGLQDLVCVPRKYIDIDPAQWLTDGQVVHARIDETVETKQSGLDVIAHTIEQGVRIEFDADFQNLAKGDEVAVRINEINDGVRGQFGQIISIEDRLTTPMSVNARTGGE
jgi:hypothetical protein